MKTAISLPDHLFEAAEQLADELGVTRSRLYANAVAEFVEHHRDETTTQALNQVYSATASDLDPLLEQLQGLSLGPEPW